MLLDNLQHNVPKNLHRRCECLLVSDSQFFVFYHNIEIVRAHYQILKPTKISSPKCKNGSISQINNILYGRPMGIIKK